MANYTTGLKIVQVITQYILFKLYRNLQLIYYGYKGRKVGVSVLLKFHQAQAHTKLVAFKSFTLHVE